MSSTRTQIVHPLSDFYLQKAVIDIYRTYGDEVGVLEKAKNLVKFGRSEQVQTATKTTLMTLPAGIYNETYATTNAITTVSSASTLDTSANNTADVVIEGHYFDGNGDLIFHVQSAILNGQNQVTLSQALCRATRIYNADSVEITGPVYVYRTGTATAGVPDTSANVHLMMRAGEQQSEKASTSVSSTDYWIITGAYADMLSKNDWNAEVAVEVRELGGVFRKVFDMSCSKASGVVRKGTPYIIVPPNSDIRMRALSSNANAIVSGGIFGVLARVM